MKRWISRAANRLGLRPAARTEALPQDFSPEMAATIEAVRPYTMTSPERIAALVDATHYVARHRIPGAIVECGVWKGGSMMAVARTLLAENDPDRELYLFDTYSGMTRPGENDVALDGTRAADEFHDGWCSAGVALVRDAMRLTRYDERKMYFVEGLVEETIPAGAPEQIALLRLDTDWYESTRHEMIHLFPRLAPGGVLIIDDYGHWQGARRAVDEYLAEHRIPLLLCRIDYTARIAVVPPRVRETA
ncbi:MAG TPA: TylF/MycF/NovP-related O-methyltransferase [Thermoanaerobaculia bacterium]|jgi:hypothetical protein